VREFQTITDPSGGAEAHRQRRLMLLREMRPVLEAESFGRAPKTPDRYDFICDARMAGLMAAVGSAYGEGEPPTVGEFVKVNGVTVRVLHSTTTLTYGGPYVCHQIEIERADA
jgi:hypothetical protein